MIPRITARQFALFSALLATGCTADVGASSLSVPKDGATQCANQCAVMGLSLSAVAIMANNVGCVCQVQPAARTQGTNAVAPAGMATILLAEEQRRASQQQSTAR